MDTQTARQAIIDAQLGDRPLGVPPKVGLLYQPVPFDGFDDLGCERNSSEHRLDMLVDWLGLTGPQRILDLGCANGFFLFRLAQLGLIEEGLGVDYFAGNVQTCRILADFHGLSQLGFREATIGPDMVDALTGDRSWDVVLWLSVHHHLIRTQSIDAAQSVLRRLYERCGVVVVEQGSLTQAEYGQWTGRSEPFSTRAYSRLLSMAEAASIPAGHAFCVGMGRYLSGQRDDMDGAGRVILGFSRDRDLPRRIEAVQRKAHKNGIFMELMHLTGEQLWKNVVTAPRHHAVRESAALDRLAGARGFVRCLGRDPWERQQGELRLARRALRPVELADIEEFGVRVQAVQRLLSLADAGLVHGELHAEHLQLDGEELVCLDLETARGPDESVEAWWRDVGADNPALGLGSYPRQAAQERPDELDLLALDSVFAQWGVPALTETERAEYRARLAAARR